MIIGIDIDDTITNSSDVFIKYAQKYNKENNITFQIDTTKLNQKQAFGWNRYHQREFSKKYLREILNDVKPKANAVKVINQLKKDGYQIFIITARNDKEVSNVYNFTEEWLRKNNIKFDKLIVNCYNKAHECAQNHVDFFIDDNFKNCKNVYKKIKIPVFLFNTNYNINNSNSVINRVFDWNEIYMNVKNGGNEKYE